VGSARDTRDLSALVRAVLLDGLPRRQEPSVQSRQADLLADKLGDQPCPLANKSRDPHIPLVVDQIRDRPANAI
jgi:hypothetical protein